MSADREAAIRREHRIATTTRRTESDSWLNGYQDDVGWLLAELAAARELLAWYVRQHGLMSYTPDNKCRCPKCREARAILTDEGGEP